jgi:hypothetical protein
VINQNRDLRLAELGHLHQALAARALELGTAESLSGMDSVVGLAAHGKSQ